MTLIIRPSLPDFAFMQALLHAAPYQPDLHIFSEKTLFPDKDFPLQADQ